jgi:hypothetical protein
MMRTHEMMQSRSYSINHTRTRMITRAPPKS